MIIALTILFPALPLLAQHITSVDSFNKNTFSWNQQEKEFGFAHFDQIFGTHEVPKGKKVHKLLPGKTIAAFSKGGQKEMEFNSFITEQKYPGCLFYKMAK